jgi:hypothetical protein
VILTKEFLEQQQACAEGIQLCIDNNYFGLEYNQVIKNFISIDQKDYAGWLIEQKSTEQYLRANGSVITMGAYQIFNPLTGQHTRYETESEAKTALIEVAQAVLNQQCPRVVQELANENGDTTWISTNMNESLVVS